MGHTLGFDAIRTQTFYQPYEGIPHSESMETGAIQ